MWHAFANAHAALETSCALKSAARRAKPSRFAKFVKRSMLKVEILLKLVLAPPDTLLASYKQMAGELGAGQLHGDDLQRVMELKGTRAAEQQKVLANIESDDADTTRVTSRLKRLFSTAETSKFVDRFNRLRDSSAPAATSGADASAADASSAARKK